MTASVSIIKYSISWTLSSKWPVSLRLLERMTVPNNESYERKQLVLFNAMVTRDWAGQWIVRAFTTVTERRWRVREVFQLCLTSHYLDRSSIVRPKEMRSGRTHPPLENDGRVESGCWHTAFGTLGARTSWASFLLFRKALGQLLFHDTRFTLWWYNLGWARKMITPCVRDSPLHTIPASRVRKKAVFTHLVHVYTTIPFLLQFYTLVNEFFVDVLGFTRYGIDIEVWAFSWAELKGTSNATPL